MRGLRVGLLIRDQLVEERIFDGAQPVRFGHSLRCQLSVPVDGVPHDHVLFAVDQGTWRLRPAPAMTGRVGSGERVEPIQGDVALPRGARGRLQLGEATILFQDIAPIPKAPRPQLPASVRGTLADRIDRRLALIIGGSLAVHIAIGAWAWTTDRELASPLAANPPPYTVQTVDVIDDPLAPPPQQPGVAAPVAPVQAPHRIVTPTRIVAPHQHVDPGEDAIRMASILAGDQPSRDGTGDMHARQPGADLGTQLEDARHHHVEVGSTDRTSRVDDRLHIDDPHRPIVDDPTLVQTPPHRDPDVQGRIHISPLPTDDEKTTLTVDAVLGRINGAYMAGLMRCYKKGLVADATLSGKVALVFTVDDRGRVTDPEASGVTDAVDACIASQMAGWRFPIPKDKQGTPTDASFRVSLALQPS